MKNEVIYADLNSEEKEILIQLFYEMYFNTEQDVKEFGSEFFFLVGTILSGSIPLKLEYLVGFEEAILLELPRLEPYFEGRE